LFIVLFFDREDAPSSGANVSGPGSVYILLDAGVSFQCLRGSSRLATDTLLRYIATIVIVFVFLGSIQLLRYSGSDANTPASTTGWRNWNLWPQYTGEPGEIGKLPTPPKFTRPENVPPKMGLEHDSWSQETTTLPLVIPTQAPVPSVVSLETKTKAAEKTEKTEEPKAAKETPECPAASAQMAAPLPALNTTFNVPRDIVYSPAGPKPNQIVVVTASDGNGHNGGIEDILGQTASNRKQYCEYHGYNYHFVNISKFDIPNAHPVWKKIPAIVEAFNAYPEAQWVFFLDLDAIIMSPKQELTKLTLSYEGMKKSLDFGREFTGSERTPLGVYMPQQGDMDLAEIDMLVAQDHNGINAGSFFLRRSKYTQIMLDMWADPFFMHMDWAGKEQDTLVSNVYSPISTLY
jgi:hypothetical protein